MKVDSDDDGYQHLVAAVAQKQSPGFNSGGIAAAAPPFSLTPSPRHLTTFLSLSLLFFLSFFFLLFFSLSSPLPPVSLASFQRGDNYVARRLPSGTDSFAARQSRLDNANEIFHASITELATSLRGFSRQRPVIVKIEHEHYVYSCNIAYMYVQCCHNCIKQIQ